VHPPLEHSGEPVYTIISGFLAASFMRYSFRINVMVICFAAALCDTPIT